MSTRAEPPELALLEREAELATFRSLAVAARSGEGGVVAIEGTAGIGKIAHGTCAKAVKWDVFAEPARGGDEDNTPANRPRRTRREHLHASLFNYRYQGLLLDGG